MLGLHRIVFAKVQLFSLGIVLENDSLNEGLSEKMVI